MTAPTCPHCGGRIPRGPYARAIGRLEDVEWLLDNGEAPEQIAKQLGIRTSALASWLMRHDRLDLARVFWRAEWRERNVA